MIAIKMDMPPNCLECPFMYFEYGNNGTIVICEVLQRYMIYAGKLFEALSRQRMKDCPLIEVKALIEVGKCEEKKI